MTKPLYEIADELQALIDRSVDYETGEVAEDALEAIGKLEMSRDAKLLDCAAAVKMLRLEAKQQDAMRAEIAAVAAGHSARRDRAEKKADWLLGYISYFHPEGSHPLGDARAEIRRHKDRKSVLVVDVDIIPDHLCRITRGAAKNLIQEEFDAGREVPGACPSKPGTHVVVK